MTKESDEMPYVETVVWNFITETNIFSCLFEKWKYTENLCFSEI